MSTPDAVIGFPRESTPGDRRTLLTPTVARRLRKAGFQVLAESGVATGVFGADADLAAEAVRFVEPERAWAAPLVLRYKCTDPADLGRLRPGQAIGALFHAEGDPAMLSALVDSKVSAYSTLQKSHVAQGISLTTMPTRGWRSPSWMPRRRCLPLPRNTRPTMVFPPGKSAAT